MTLLQFFFGYKKDFTLPACLLNLAQPPGPHANDFECVDIRISIEMISGTVHIRDERIFTIIVVRDENMLQLQKCIDEAIVLMKHCVSRIGRQLEPHTTNIVLIGDVIELSGETVDRAQSTRFLE